MLTPRPVALVALCALAACSGGAGPSTPPTIDPGVPAAACAPPEGLRDVSRPAAVVGDGTPQGCTEAALRAAAAGGGVIVFDCGPDPVTVTVASPIVFTKAAVLDGGGRVTLSGGGASRILYLDSAWDLATPRLVVQRLTFRDGQSPRMADDTASGGGAIYRDGGSLSVIDCAFLDNRAPSPGQDIAGGALYAFGGGDTVIVGSRFAGNQASNGGAVGSLQGTLTIVNSTFTGNAATGTGGNPGDGGCGGALYQDGAGEGTTLCGVTIAGNQAGGLGGGVFRVSNTGTGTFAMDRTAVDANAVTPSASGNAGGLYLQGLDLLITDSTISRNRAFYGGGLWITRAGAGQMRLTNVTIAGNEAFGSNGGGLWLSGSPPGALLNCTLAGNQATAQDVVAGAIFGDGPTLKNTLIADNTAMWRAACYAPLPDAGGNLQWPDADPRCTGALTLADPLLGPLGDHGGPTETMVPDAASPARGAGGGCPAVDQRGEPRAGACTSGAVEIP